MRFAITIFFLTILHHTSAAQSLEGMVIDKDSRMGVPAITVINRQSGVVAFSDADGYYKIVADAGDTIQFRHTAYVPAMEVMVYSMGTRFKSIVMQPLVYNMKEQSITALTKYQQDSLERHEQFYHELTKTVVAPPQFTLGTGIGCVGCFGWLADKLTGNSKKPKRFRKQMATDDQAMFVDSRYTPELVARLTEIKNVDSLAAFIYKHPMDYEFARAASDLELKAWIRHAYRASGINDTSTKQ